MEGVRGKNEWMNTTITTINPATGEPLETYDVHSEAQVNEMLDQATSAQRRWATTSFEHRANVLRDVAEQLRQRQGELAVLMAREMGKPLAQGEGEAQKCAWVCDFYADEAQRMLADVARESELDKAWTVYQPLGTVLAVMPWNFPLWQVLRFAAPTLMAGNVGVLKHASSVTGSALVIEELFRAAGAEEGVFRTLVLPSNRVEAIVADDRIAAVTLTGSEGAGRAVASQAGRHLKPSVLELGGSDAYVVLSDADVGMAAAVCADSRLMNSGQSCIAAKRFIVVDDVHDEFVEAFGAELERRVVGDPFDPSTDVGPQAKAELRDELHDQVVRSVDAGANVLFGGQHPGRPWRLLPRNGVDRSRAGNAGVRRGTVRARRRGDGRSKRGTRDRAGECQPIRTRWCRVHPRHRTR